MLSQGAHGHKAGASKAAAKAGTHGHKPLAPAAAACASALAQCLSDPPPRRADGRPQRGGGSRPAAMHTAVHLLRLPYDGCMLDASHACVPAPCLSPAITPCLPPPPPRRPQTHMHTAATHVAQLHQAGGGSSFPLSPAQHQGGGFGFNTPSPDDRAKAARPAGACGHVLCLRRSAVCVAGCWLCCSGVMLCRLSSAPPPDSRLAIVAAWPCLARMDRAAHCGHWAGAIQDAHRAAAAGGSSSTQAAGSRRRGGLAVAAQHRWRPA
jgi:hypothetical protein